MLGRREVAILHHLVGHPALAQIHGVYEDKHYVHIIMQVGLLQVSGFWHSGGSWLMLHPLLAAAAAAVTAVLERVGVPCVPHAHFTHVTHKDTHYLRNHCSHKYVYRSLQSLPCELAVHALIPARCPVPVCVRIKVGARRRAV